ncbi:MAG: heparin lyase I family protein [Moheibacter sp.]
MRKISLVFFILFANYFEVFGQIYFDESFEFSDFETFKEISEERERWTFFHSENQDFDNNGKIDPWENIKMISFDDNNTDDSFIHFYLKRMNEGILRNDVMKNGEINNEKVDYHNFFTHIARNEIATWDSPNQTSYWPNQNYYFEFEIMVPDDFVFESQNCSNPSKSNYELTGQWHFSYAVLKGQTMSPISLRIVCNQWMLNLNPNNDKEEKDTDFISLGNIEKGKWVNWKFQIKFSNKKRGKIKVWKNGLLVFSKEKSKNIFAKKVNGLPVTVYLKIGVYKPHWWSRESDVSEREINFDNVKVSY